MADEENLSKRDIHFNNKMRSISEQLAAVEKIDVVRMPESVFVAGYLPLFCGEDNPRYNVTFDMWKTYAGGVFNEVIVIDDTGKELFTVPPLFDRAYITTLVKEQTRSLTDVITTAEQYALIHPVKGNAYLDRELSNRALLMNSSMNVSSNVKRWNEIFRRYGKPEIVVGKDIEKVAEAEVKMFDDFEPF